MISGCKIPVQIRRKIVQIVVLANHCLAGKQCLSRLTGVAGTVAKGQTQRIRIGKFPAEISRSGRVAEVIARSLPLGREVLGAGRIVESAAQQTAELRATVSGAEGAAVTLEGELRHCRGSAMCENLYHAIHRVGAVQRAGGAMDDLDLVHIQKREI